MRTRSLDVGQTTGASEMERVLPSGFWHYGGAGMGKKSRTDRGHRERHSAQEMLQESFHYHPHIMLVVRHTSRQVL